MSENFLKEISKEAPKKFTGSFQARLFKWCLIAISYACAVVAIVGIRKDYFHVSQSLQFWIDVILLVIMALSASVVCFRLSIPGQEKKARLFSLYLPISAWVISNLITFFLNKEMYMGILHGIFAMCFYEILIISTIPAFVLFKVSTMTGLRYHKYVTLSCFLAAASFCALAVQFSCSNSHPLHTLVSHILPTVIFTFIGLFIVKKVFSRKA